MRGSPDPRQGARLDALIALGTAAGVLLGVVTLSTTGGAAAPPLYPASPPPAHTGGFGEPTCHSCHFEANLNEPGGTLSLAGAPTAYLPGESYRLEVVLTHGEMVSAGFQLAVRLADGPHAGAQAGELRPLDDRTAITIDGERRVQYLHHTDPGSRLRTPGTTRWSFEWIAPVAGAEQDGSGAVVFHLVANAADGDDSPFGDLIYATALELPRGAPGPQGR